MSIQFKIDKLIEAKGLSKTKFAAAIGVNRDTVYNLNENTKLGTYLKICEYFKIELSDIIGNKKPKIGLSVVHEEAEVYGEVNYKEKYLDALEKLNAANERLLQYSDLKKGLTKKK